MSDTPHQRPSSRPRLVLLALVSAGLVTGCSKTAENGPTSSSTKPPANTGPAEANAEVTSTSPAADATPKKMQRRIVHAWDGVTMWATILNTNYYESPNREIPKPAEKFSQRILEELVDEEAVQFILIAICFYLE